MPFDAGFCAAVVRELCDSALGARIDKIYQPEKDMAVLFLKTGKDTKKLLLSAAAGLSRFGYTEEERENPAVPPMFCMLLRKHLVGGHIVDVRQLGFERAVEIVVSSHDEMGFASRKSVIVEIMGTYSNVILLDEQRRVLAAVRYVDLSANAKRQILPGFPYELPPAQEGKRETLEMTRESFLAALSRDLAQGCGEMTVDKYVLSHYKGVSPLIAREISFRAAKHTPFRLADADPERLWAAFREIYGLFSSGKLVPYLLYDKDKKPVDYSFCEIRQYGLDVVCTPCASFGELLDRFHAERDRAESVRRKGQDILRLLTAASARIEKKIALQQADLAACADKEKHRRWGDLITAHMYRLKKGMSGALLEDYTDLLPDGTPNTVQVPLDLQLTPSQNAQKYYRLYAKAKTREVQLAAQIADGREELAYIDTVFDALTRAEGEKDLSEIREELVLAGYGKRLETFSRPGSHGKAKKQKLKKYDFLEFRTSGGYRVLCGKNNLQNDYLTTELADKSDLWFHVKGLPGSHTVMLCGKDEPPAADYTECAAIAAYHSKGRGTPNLPVDYTRVKNVRKPSGAKPGYVIYETNHTAYVTAKEETVEALRVT